MIPYLADDDDIAFPPVDQAIIDREANGLLCAGGSLSPGRLINAYQNGIFPWYSEGEPVLWWSPNPRAVIFSKDIHISRSTRRTMRKGVFEIRHNTAFKAVVEACAAPRVQQADTWILPEMIQAYSELHRLGYAHSYECWHQDELVGGVYGIKINGVFCGESMFSAMTNASKIALIHIAQLTEYDLIDCQIPNPHLLSLGASTIARADFIQLLKDEPNV